MVLFFFFFQAEDGIRDLVRSRGLGDVYKRQTTGLWPVLLPLIAIFIIDMALFIASATFSPLSEACLLYTSDAADERSSVDLGGRRIIKKQKTIDITL